MPNDEIPPLDTYAVEMKDGRPADSYPLAPVYVKVREGDRELLMRAPEVANDDDPEAARQNAAAIGRRAGLVGVEEEELDSTSGSFHEFFTGRGRTREQQARARGAEREAQLKGTAGARSEAAINQDGRDPMLVESEARDREQAAEFGAEADSVEESVRALTPLERGLISPALELASSIVLGLADVALFGIFLKGRAAVDETSAWIVAVLVGLGAAATGWAAGRAALGRATEHAERRRSLMALLVAVGLSGIWFLIGMEITRASGGGEGELATIAFGAPLCAMAITAAAIISFVGGAGATGRQLAGRAAQLRTRANERLTSARAASTMRHELVAALAAASGAELSASEQLDAVRRATEHAADAELREGEARWGLARTFARMYPKPDPTEFDFELLQRDELRRREAERKMRRLGRLLATVFAALGAGVAALGTLLAGAPVELIALLTSGGGALGARMAPQPQLPDEPPVRLIPAAPPLDPHQNGNGKHPAGATS